MSWSVCCGRHVGILEIKENKIFRINKVKLKTVRPFYMEDLVLRNTDIDPTQEDMVMAYLVNKVSNYFYLVAFCCVGKGRGREPKSK